MPEATSGHSLSLMQSLYLSARILRYVCIGAAATAFTHLAALVPVLRWGYVVAAALGVSWLAYILFSYWAAHARHPIAWFEHGGDVLDLLGPTLTIAISIGFGLFLGAPFELMRIA
jgi:sulfite exporter TauE/SafE